MISTSASSGVLSIMESSLLSSPSCILEGLRITLQGQVPGVRFKYLGKTLAASHIRVASRTMKLFTVIVRGQMHIIIMLIFMTIQKNMVRPMVVCSF